MPGRALAIATLLAVTATNADAQNDTVTQVGQWTCAMDLSDVPLY
jgi:hypothetical protein